MGPFFIAYKMCTVPSCDYKSKYSKIAVKREKGKKKELKLRITVLSEIQ